MTGGGSTGHWTSEPTAGGSCRTQSICAGLEGDGLSEEWTSWDLPGVSHMRPHLVRVARDFPRGVRVFAAFTEGLHTCYTLLVEQVPWLTGLVPKKAGCPGSYLCRSTESCSGMPLESPLRVTGGLFAVRGPCGMPWEGAGAHGLAVWVDDGVDCLVY